MLQDIKIREMSKEEYFFLTENLEFVDKNSICNGVRYLVYNKKKRLLDVVQKVMQNELTEDERNLAIDYWSGEYSLGEISKRNNITRSAIYRHIDSIKGKIETSLKYVLIYDANALPQSTNELMNFIKETQIEQRNNVSLTASKFGQEWLFSKDNWMPPDNRNLPSSSAASPVHL